MGASYFLITNFLALFSIFFVLKNRPWGSKQENDQFTWHGKYTFLVIIFFVIGAIRPVIEGTDNESYVILYQYVKSFGELPLYLERSELGYSFLNMLFGWVFGLPYYVFFGFITALTWAIYIASSYRYQFLLPWMLYFTICNGFLFWSFNGVRQAIAIVLFLFSIRFIIERNILVYTFVLMLASLFHLSALLLLPLYVVINIKFNRRFWLFAYLASIPFMANAFFTSLIGKFIDWFFKNIPYFSFYQRYTDKENFLASRHEAATDSGLGVLLNLFVTVFIIFFSNNTLKRFPGLDLFFLLFASAAVVGNLFFGVELVGRLMRYFFPVFGLLMAATIYSMKKRPAKIMFVGFFAIYLTLFIKLAISKFN